MIKEIFPMDTWHTSKDADYNSNAETKLASTEKQSIVLVTVIWQLQITDLFLVKIKEQHKNYKVVYVKIYKISKHKWTDRIK